MQAVPKTLAAVIAAVTAAPSLGQCDRISDIDVWIDAQCQVVVDVTWSESWVTCGAPSPTQVQILLSRDRPVSEGGEILACRRRCDWFVDPWGPRWRQRFDVGGTEGHRNIHIEVWGGTRSGGPCAWGGGPCSPAISVYHPLAADLDGDGVLTFFDFLEFAALFGAGDPVADFDGDGELTVFDFLAFQSAFAEGCP